MWRKLLLLPALLVVLSQADDSSIDNNLCSTDQDVKSSLTLCNEKCGQFEWRNPETKMCECEEYYGRNSSGKCIFCINGRREVRRKKDGSRICTCREGYLLNANGGCDRDPSVYGFGFCFVGFLMISLMGLVCGYVARQYSNDGYNPCVDV